MKEDNYMINSCKDLRLRTQVWPLGITIHHNGGTTYADIMRMRGMNVNPAYNPHF